MSKLSPAEWVFDLEKQASVLPSEHPVLVQAMTRLWESEVGANGVQVALEAGVMPALQMMMGAAITYVLANEDYEAWRSTKHRMTKSGLMIAGEGDAPGIAKLASAMEQVRGPRPR
jgi:hypothetical protein